MKSFLFIFLLWLFSGVVCGQDYRNPDGGAGFNTEKQECLSAEEYTRIFTMLDRNTDSLIRTGILIIEDFQNRNTVSNKRLIWPLARNAGLTYHSFYGISNYVDLDAAYPDKVLDWNCGKRTYDSNNGYNHAGTDIFLWPFPQQLQKNDQVAVVAAIDGIIVLKDDGRADNSCSLNGKSWNAVYIKGSDGFTYWYGHLKRNSLTTKKVGDHVNQGEFLGIVGSSGNSTGPHLHFEIYDTANKLIDPFSGTCNKIESLWLDQKPYYEPTINVIMTHGVAPVYPDCPKLETIGDKDYFMTGDNIYFGSYYHDHLYTLTANHQVIDPDGQIYSSWTHKLRDGLYYSGSWWYWSDKINASMLSGKWTYKVAYAGQTLSHDFYVNVDTTSTVQNYLDSGQKYLIYPNPNSNSFSIANLQQPVLNIEIYDLTGRVVFKSKQIENEDIAHVIETHLPKGAYIIIIRFANGATYSERLIIVD